MVVFVLIAGLFLGNFITGMATNRPRFIGGGGDVSCADYDNDGYFGQNNCGTLRDCNDNNAKINPAAEEFCGDALDDNCDAVSPSCNAIMETVPRKTQYKTNEQVTLR